jgi:hypothetical protein
MAYRKKLCRDIPTGKTRFAISVIPAEHGSGFTIEREGCEYDWREPSTKISPVLAILGLPPFATEEAAINQAEIIVHNYLVNQRFLVCPDEQEEEFSPR